MDDPDDLARAASDAVDAWRAEHPAPTWQFTMPDNLPFTPPTEPVTITYTRRPTPDELVHTALATMLHDHTGLSGTLDVTDLSDLQRLNHLENCPYSVIAGPIGCEQDCTDTGSGMEILTAQAGCPHGAPITVRTGSYGTGGLLDKMIALGQRIDDERAGSDDDDQ